MQSITGGYLIPRFAGRRRKRKTAVAKQMALQILTLCGSDCSKGACRQTWSNSFQKRLYEPDYSSMAAEISRLDEEADRSFELQREHIQVEQRLTSEDGTRQSTGDSSYSYIRWRSNRLICCQRVSRERSVQSFVPNVLPALDRESGSFKGFREHTTASGGSE